MQKKPEEINRRSADMWSFAVLLWELVTREVPFADLSNMEIGMKVRRGWAQRAGLARPRQGTAGPEQPERGRVPPREPTGAPRPAGGRVQVSDPAPFSQVALEGLRPTIPPGISPHICKLMKICMNEDPAKRPKFDMIVPILEKMQEK